MSGLLAQQEEMDTIAQKSKKQSKSKYGILNVYQLVFLTAIIL